MDTEFTEFNDGDRVRLKTTSCWYMRLFGPEGLPASEEASVFHAPKDYGYQFFLVFDEKSSLLHDCRFYDPATGHEVALAPSGRGYSVGAKDIELVFKKVYSDGVDNWV